MKMSEILNEIRKQVGEESLASSCSGSGCRVDMTGIPRERVLVDVDQAFRVHQRIGKRCDKMLFHGNSTEDTLVAVLMELKSGTFKATDVSQQLQGGAHFAATLIPRDIQTICIPLVFHGERVHRAQSGKLKDATVRFRNQRVPITRSKCGVSKNLVNVLSRLGYL